MQTEAGECILHLTLLDAALHTTFTTIQNYSEDQLHEGFVPTFIRNMTVSGQMCSYKRKKEPQLFKVYRRTQMPGKRVAHGDLYLLLDD